MDNPSIEGASYREIHLINPETSIDYPEVIN